MNYARFYALLKRLPVHTEGIKSEFVRQYTNGRTESLRDMTQQEYVAMCNAIEKSLKDKCDTSNEEIRHLRSRSLKLMQELGIDTTDWRRINDFCRDKRITGKEFYQLSVADLEALTVKLRSIVRNGGLKPHKEVPEKAAAQVIFFQDNGIIN